MSDVVDEILREHRKRVFELSNDTALDSTVGNVFSIADDEAKAKLEAHYTKKIEKAESKGFANGERYGRDMELKEQDNV